MSIKSEKAEMAAGLAAVPSVTTKRATSNISAPAAMMGLSSGYKEMQAEVERLKRSEGKAVRVRMDLCDDGPYHTTPLDPERVQDLKANLAENPQSAPALVRVKADGRLEIIAGRHRKAALTELSHEEWDVSIRDFDDDQAERLTFYDNLLAPSITDYAKYRGFAARKEHKGLSLEQLAKESGKGKGTVVGLMSFGKLPEEALAVIAANQKKFGFNMVAKLAQLVDEHRDAVIKVVEMVAAGLKQDEAPVKVLELASANGAKKAAAPAKAQSREGRVTVAWEGREYATVDVSAKKLTITLADKAEAEFARKVVVKALEERAKKARS